MFSSDHLRVLITGSALIPAPEAFRDAVMFMEHPLQCLVLRRSSVNADFNCSGAT